MGQDRTAEFNELVAATTRNGEGQTAKSSSWAPPELSDFSQQSLGVLADVQALAGFIRTHRTEYLDLTPASLYRKQMAPAQREKFETQVEQAARTLGAHVKRLEASVAQNTEQTVQGVACRRVHSTGKDSHAHRTQVVGYLRHQVQSVRQTFSDLQKLRAKLVEQQRGSSARRKPAAKSAVPDSQHSERAAHNSKTHNEQETALVASASGPDANSAKFTLWERPTAQQLRQRAGQRATAEVERAEDRTQGWEGPGAEREETQEYEEEDADLAEKYGAQNQALLTSLQTKADHLMHAEQTTTEIMQLMGQLETELQAQQDTIENLHSTSVQSTDNIHSGVSHLTQASETGVSNRIVMLAFLVTASCSLLFLDWIMP